MLLVLSLALWCNQHWRSKKKHKSYETFKHICRIADSGNSDGRRQCHGGRRPSRSAGRWQHLPAARRFVNGLGSREAPDLALKDQTTWVPDMQTAGTQVVFFLQSSDSSFQTDVDRFGSSNQLKS